ncbi:MAG: VOC family protein [Pseudomonadota bacterium]
MPITGIESLVYRVGDVELSTRFFTDFGLPPKDTGQTLARFELMEGSQVIVRHRDDAALPLATMEGDGVCQVIWGVDSQRSLEQLVDALGKAVDVTRDRDGTAHFLTPFGIPMGLRLFAKRPVVYAPDPVNAPGRVNRLNQHRKWRERARPKVINHVVWAIEDYEGGFAFMRDYLGFRLSDHQRGFGMYLRADGSCNHHNLFLINANARFPGMDGKVRFHHANFGVEDIDEVMTGANYMTRKGWDPSHLGLGRHRIDSALFYYLPCPAGGEAEYGTDSDYLDDNWVPRDWINPLFGFASFIHNLPPFLAQEPDWNFRYITEGTGSPTEGEH